MRGMAVAVAPHPYHSSLNLSARAALVPVALLPTLVAHLRPHLSPHLPHSAALVAVVVALLPTLAAHLCHLSHSAALVAVVVALLPTLAAHLCPRLAQLAAHSASIRSQSWTQWLLSPNAKFRSGLYLVGGFNPSEKY